MMLGKSVGLRAVPVLTLSLLTVACAHNVNQDKASGADSKTKGARELTFENGEAKATGIVTYPGGDRVDWKLLTLPEGQKGDLDIRLQWTPPRPGLQLAFDVFDEWYHPVLSAKGGKRRSRGRSKSGKLTGAKGKYYVRVYAVGRGDAGKYKLTAELKETSQTLFDPLKLEVPEPPKLAAVPEPEVPCNPMQFDPKNPACASVCPEFGAPPGWPACKDKCPSPPDVNLESCQRTMPCPNPPDRRVKSCKKSQWPKCDLANKDPQNPNCDDAKAPAVTARVLKNEIQGSELVITIGAGSNSGIEKGWSAVVLRGTSDSPLSGGEVTIVRIDKQTTIGKVRLTADQLKQNGRVKLSPP